MTPSQAILRSLQVTPLLSEQVRGAALFDRALLSPPAKGTVLNFDQKLGHLYEDALESLIRQSPQLQLIDQHVQIFDQHKRTIGELDFILLDKVRGQHIHLELAVKFYLALPTDDGGWRYPGPDDRDNWDRKRARMQDHQFTLSQREEAKTLLQDRYGIDAIDTQHLIYGCLFLPMNCPHPPQPEAISPNARKGRWLRMRDWDAHFSDVQSALAIPKHLWPICVSNDTEHLLEDITAEDLKTRAQARGVMFAVKNNEGTYARYFMVHDEWGRGV